MAHWLHRLRSSPTASLLVRFTITGVVAGGVQIVLLEILLALGAQALPGNAFAFFVAAQFNFALSHFFTWRNRVRPASMSSAWPRFMCAIAATAVLNLGAFSLANMFVTPMVAAALGIAAAATVNFALSDRLVFVDLASAAAGRRGATHTSLSQQEH